MLYDSNVLIHSEHLDDNAMDLIENDPNRSISVVTFLEILAGVGKKSIEKSVEKLKNYFVIIPITNEIQEKSLALLLKDVKRPPKKGESKGMKAMDAIIAATSVATDMTLCTENTDHFAVLNDFYLLKKFERRKVSSV